MGLDLKRLRGRTLALIVGGIVVLAAVLVGAIVVAAGGSGGSTTASSKLDTSFKAPRPFESIDAVYGEESYTCAPTDTQCVRKFLVKVTDDYGPKAALGVMERLQRDNRVSRSCIKFT